jgi:methylated-DNA-[protein]-cysteine S-methyltransferase
MPRPFETSDRTDPPHGIEASLCLFESPLGRCAIAWTDAGVRAVQLPSIDDDATLARLARAAGVAAPGSRRRCAIPPPQIADAVAGIVELLGGAPRDLREVALDTTGIPAFALRVYALAREIAPGATLSYGELAARLGDPGAARAVGRALGDNPFVIIVPCHRVLAAGGRPGGFSAPGGLATKRRLLAIEAACRPALSPGQSGRLF